MDLAVVKRIAMVNNRLSIFVLRSHPENADALRKSIFKVVPNSCCLQISFLVFREPRKLVRPLSSPAQTANAISREETDAKR